MKFDDRTLINLARYDWFRMKTQERPEIDALFGKSDLTNEERNTLLAFLRDAKAANSPQISIRAMKSEIFQLIGVPNRVDNPHPTINRKELELIYNHLKGIKNEET